MASTKDNTNSEILSESSELSDDKDKDYELPSRKKPKIQSNGVKTIRKKNKNTRVSTVNTRLNRVQRIARIKKKFVNRSIPEQNTPKEVISERKNYNNFFKNSPDTLENINLIGSDSAEAISNGISEKINQHCCSSCDDKLEEIIAFLKALQKQVCRLEAHILISKRNKNIGVNMGSHSDDDLVIDPTPILNQMQLPAKSKEAVDHLESNLTSSEYHQKLV